MQTAKTLLTLLALGLCIVPVSQARPDTEAQAKAREALRRKIAELNGKPFPAAPAAAPTAAFAEPPATPTGLPPATPEQTERLREATRQKIAELKAQGKPKPPVAAVPAPAAVAEPPTQSAAERRAEERAAAAERRAQEKAAAAEQRRLAEEEKARQKAEAEEAKARQKAEAEAAKAREQAEAEQAKKAQAVKPAAKPAAISFDPIPAPPSPIPASKEARLAELLKQYKADEISPEQYHTERAKILAEP